MTKNFALAGALLTLRPALRDELIEEVGRRGQTTVLPGLVHSRDQVESLPPGTTVLVLVTDPMTLLNAAYCRRLLDLHHAAPFAAWVREHVDDDPFQPAESLAAVLARPDLDVELVVREGEALDAGLPGPTLVSATRILHKRLRATGAFHRLGRAHLTAAVEQLRAVAEEQQWDDTAFWGWTPGLRRQMSPHFEAADDALADYAATSWPPPLPERATATVALSEARPTVVYQVMTAIQDIVQQNLPDHAAETPATAPRRGRLRRALSRLRGRGSTH